MFRPPGPAVTRILEAVTGESFTYLRFSRWRRIEVIVARQGVTGEVGYVFMRTDGYRESP